MYMIVYEHMVIFESFYSHSVILIGFIKDIYIYISSGD